MRRIFLGAGAMLLAMGFVACGPGEHGHAFHGEHGHEAHEEPGQRGAHGGRLLHDGDFTLEAAIFEDGVPPQWRLYATRGGRAVSPDALQATLTLHRVTGLPGGATDVHEFRAADDYLFSDATVYGPHSFDVSLRVVHEGRTHEWHYESPENQVHISPEAVEAADVGLGTAGPGTVAETLRLYGRIVPDAERLRQVRARFPGPVQQVQVRVGDRVRAGQVLATVESNESLQVYPVTAPIAGTVITRNVNGGEAAADQPLFEILDDARVWAELSVYPGDRGRLAVGQQARVRGADGRVEADARIVHIAPFGNAAQAVTVRAMLDNAGGRWTPGQFVDAEVTVSRSEAALVVPVGAVQKLGDNDVVFVTDGERFQALPVELGRRDGQQVEVLAGLGVGARIVVQNSWLVKADIGKSGAAHEH